MKLFTLYTRTQVEVEDPLYVYLCLCHICPNLQAQTILDTLEKVRNRFLTAECSHFALMGSYSGSILYQQLQLQV